MTYVLLVAGLALLLIGGEFLVRGGMSLAGHFRISPMVIGLTVVSFGTSAPELVVSLDAAILGHPDISLGNVIGSNISNIAFVLALTVIITPFVVSRREIIDDMIIMTGTFVLLLIMLNDLKFSRYEGLILLALLLAYIYRSIRNDRRHLIARPADIKYSLPVSVLIIILSSLGLVTGADLLVNSAGEIAAGMGVSERVISVSVIAVGTSLPELATSVMAALRKKNGISIGNVVGSNIFNVLAILGITASVKPFTIKDTGFTRDMYWMIGIAILLIIMVLPSKSARLGRWKGIFLAVVYFSYIYLVFFVR
ncbi:MAG TPA: calcium/sodium antiporter [Bacteroidetes bacterium]|nr:calcium/sodium antiporter [Bacteroidota bacterium]